jgi:hypothetical protein
MASAVANQRLTRVAVRAPAGHRASARIVSSVAPVLSTPDINQPGKILGWDLAPAGPSVDAVTSAGPDLNTRPDGEAVVPRSNTSTVETVSDLYVNGKLSQTGPVAPTV